MRKRTWLSAAVALCGIPLYGQSQTPRFEVASIREIVTGAREMGNNNFSGPRAEYHSFSIPMLIAEAYQIRADEIAFGPGVPPGSVIPMLAQGRSARIFDIVALAPEGTTPTRDEFRVMLRSLLTTRFKLAMHSEKREKEVYVLSPNGTPKLKPSSGEGPCKVAASRTAEGQKISATHCPMRTFTGNLLVGGAMYDETGLDGFYDFELTSALPFQANDSQAITPFSAVKEFNLKLELKKRMMDTMVLDHVETPGDN